MTIKYSYRLLLSFCFFICWMKVFTQEISVVEVSKEKREIYQATLNQNKGVIAFIENTLLQNGLPKMLRNLSLIESGFKRNAVSSANAGGIWQFTEGHANGYGLKNKDRFDVYHSTQTAVKSLKDLYKKYGNWITVVAAYNCGEGNIQKAMDKANSNRYDMFYTYLPSETINHVHKFMEVSSVTGELEYLITDYKMSVFNKKIENKKNVKQKDPALVSTDINGVFDLNIIAEEIDIKRSDLELWNPNIETQLKKNGIAVLYLPVDIMPDFLLLKNTILNRSLQVISYE